MNKWKFKEFLQQNGYMWSGYVAGNSGCACETFENGDEDLDDLDGAYVLLGSHYDWDEDDGYIKVTGDPFVKYIRHSATMFRVYAITENSKYELEKDLSAEWVRYQALNVEYYIEDNLPYIRHVQANYPTAVERRKNLLAQEIERLTRDANDSIIEMEDEISRSKMAEETIKQVQQERLIKQQIELGAKDNFKDNASNDACLQHLIDNFCYGE